MINVRQVFWVDGFPCLVLDNPFAGKEEYLKHIDGALTQNGYVGVPVGHMDYGKHYDKMPPGAHSMVNGGLTFSGDFKKDGKAPQGFPDGDFWYFGWDYLHGFNSGNPVNHALQLAAYLKRRKKR